MPASMAKYIRFMHGISVFAVLSRNHLSQSSSSELVYLVSCAVWLVIDKNLYWYIRVAP